MKRFVEKVRRTLADYRMIEPGERVLVGVSGGPDSVCLLHLLHALGEVFPFGLGVAHLNHALRSEASDRDAEFVARLAEFFNLPFHGEKASPETWRITGTSPEEQARTARYSFLGRISKAYLYEKIAVGHHAGDNAELYLMRLMTWSGPAGVSGIPPVRKDSQGAGTIIRPLIRCTRDEIVSYLGHHELLFTEDETNASMRFLRNRVRHHLIPELKLHYNPKIELALNRICAITSADEEWMHTLTEAMFRSAVVGDEADRCTLSMEKMLEMPVAAQRRVLRMGIEKIQGNLRRITFDHVEAVRRLLSKRAEGKRLHLPCGIRLKYDKGLLLIRRIAVNRRGDFSSPV